MSCAILLKNGNPSKLFSDLAKIYPENKAIEIYAKATTPSIISTFKKFDVNNEPTVEEVQSIIKDDKDKIRFSRTPESKKTLDIFKSIREQITKQSNDDNAYVANNGKTAERVTNAVKQFVAEFNKEEWIENSIRNKVAKIPSTNVEEYRKELEAKLIEFERSAINGTRLHAVLEIMFNEKLSSIDNLVDNNGRTRYEKLYDDETHKNLKDSNSLKSITESLFLIKNQILEGLIKSKIVSIMPEVIVYDAESNIAGTIDLVVVYEDGSVDIFDYKFSSKSVDKWSDYKFESIKYQQAFYKSILNKKGIKVNKATIISSEMKTNDGELIGVSTPQFTNIINSIRTQSEIGANVKRVLNLKIDDEIVVTDTAKSVYHIVNQLSNENKNIFGDIEIAKNSIDNFWFKVKHTGFLNSITGKRYSFNPNDRKSITDEKEQKKLIETYLTQLEQRKQELPSYFSEFVTNARLNGINNTKWSFGYNQDIVKNNILKAASKYINAKYTNENGEVIYEWDILENDTLSNLGLVMFKSKLTNMVDIVSVNSEVLTNPFETKNKGSKTILGNLLTKYQENNYDLITNSIGNLEAFKAFLYAVSSDIEFNIANIVVMSENSNPYIVTSKEMLDLIREVNRTKVFKNDEVFKEIYEKINNPMLNFSFRVDYQNYLKTILSKNLTAERKLKLQEFYNEYSQKMEGLDDLRIMLIDRIEDLNKIVDRKKAAGRQYNYYLEELRIAQQALLEIENVNIKDEVDIDKQGFFYMTQNRLFTDPDDFTTKSTKAIVEINSITVSNISKRFIDYKKKTQKTIESVINENLGRLSANVGGYTINAYDNVFEYEKDNTGKWIRTMRLRDIDNDVIVAPFQRPLTDNEKNLITTFMKVLDDTRKSKMSPQQYDDFNADPSRKREIPLLPASLLSRIKQNYTSDLSLNGILTNIRQLQKSATETYKNILNVDLAFRDDTEYQRSRELKRKMVDSFVWLENNQNKREEMINSTNEEFELDLELILDLYMLNNYKVMEYNKTLPYVNAIKSLVLLNKQQFFTSLKPEEQTNIEVANEKFIEEIIWGVKDKEQDEAQMKKLTGIMKQFTAGARLMFSPVTGAFNMLTNTWSSLSSVSLGLASDKIGLDNYLKGMMFVGMTPSNLVNNDNLVNEIALNYRVANAETYRLREVMSMSNRGINAFFSRWAHWMNSAPDYMHRVGLFSAEMIKEGTLKLDSKGNVRSDSAHQFIDGKMVYNEKLDDRFNLLFDKTSDKTSVKYLEQLAFYNALKQDLSKEAFGINEDGSLARAYSAMDSKAKVRRANLIYGDYNPENRSEMERLAVVSLFFQFKRWMKAKKNTWFMENIKLEGNREAYLYKDNDVIPHEEYKNMSEAEIQKLVDEGWVVGQMHVGRMHEGILQTLLYMYDELRLKGFKEGIDGILSMDDFRKRNLGQMFGDLLLLALISFGISMLFDKKENLLLHTVFDRSIEDLNILNIIGLNPFADFKGTNLPFASISLMEDIYFKVVGNITDPEQMTSDVLNSISIVRQFKDYVE
jgi:hypothetical protein